MSLTTSIDTNVLGQNHDKRALKRIFQSVDFLENQHSKALTSGIPIVILL